MRFFVVPELVFETDGQESIEIVYYKFDCVDERNSKTLKTDILSLFDALIDYEPQILNFTV